jgi:hypothetical protein
MNARRVEVTFDQGLWDRLEGARGHESRASFVRRALESALGSKENGGPSGAVASRAASAPSRAPVSVGTDNPASRSLESSGRRLESGLARASVKTRDELALERQAKLNKGKS